MLVWPRLKLTEYERRFADIYETGAKPGVKRRAYRVTLCNVAQPSAGLPEASLTQQLQISRRARIFALMFSGNLDMWRLSVRNANGSHYITPAPRSQQYPIVSSLVSGSVANVLADGGVAQPHVQNSGNLSKTLAAGYEAGLERPDGAALAQNMPWLIEPNWVCQPNETIIFNGSAHPPAVTVGTATLSPMRVVLNIVVYAWEFPSFGK